MRRAPREIRELAAQLADLQKRAGSLGVFPGDRELLTCSKCGLLEDVLMGGKLITYRAGAETEDSGLRFEELAEGCLRCPACGSIFEYPQVLSTEGPGAL